MLVSAKATKRRVAGFGCAAACLPPRLSERPRWGPGVGHSGGVRGAGRAFPCPHPCPFGAPRDRSSLDVCLPSRAAALGTAGETPESLPLLTCPRGRGGRSPKRGGQEEAAACGGATLAWCAGALARGGPGTGARGGPCRDSGCQLSGPLILRADGRRTLRVFVEPRQQHLLLGWNVGAQETRPARSVFFSPAVDSAVRPLPLPLPLPLARFLRLCSLGG